MEYALSENGGVAQKGYRGPGMEGFTARWYASLTHKSIDDFRALARRFTGDLAPGSQVLEVAPGPGYFAIELAKLGAYKITGVDISRTFVEIARRNARDEGVAVKFRQGDAANLPFEDGTFDFLLCRAAFKNFAQPLRALQEMHRVLAPGGRAVIIDLRRDAPRQSVSRAVDAMHLGAINTFLTKSCFRLMLLKRAYSRGDFERLLSQTGFGPIEIREDLIGLELTLHKSE